MSGKNHNQESNPGKSSEFPEQENESNSSMLHSPQDSTTWRKDSNQERLYLEKKEQQDDDLMRMLRYMLLPSEVKEPTAQIEQLQQRVTTIEHKMPDPGELIKILVPLMTQSISRKLVASEEMLQVFAFAIDRIIVKRTQRDKEAMSAAIAPLMSEAIARSVRSAPDEIAIAIAPEIAKAIAEQTRLDKEGIVKALSPSIETVIDDKIQKAKSLLDRSLSDFFNQEIAQYISNSPAEIASAIAPELAKAITQQNQLDSEAMVTAIAPIIAGAIGQSISSDKQSIDAALSPVLKDAISQYITNSPTEISQAIAPELAKAITQQNQLDSEAMVTAIAPIIAGAIGQSIKSDKQSIDTALSPVLKAAISEYISNSPAEIAIAIAPELARAIAEQTRLNKKEIVRALLPSIELIIKYKTPELKQEIEREIAELFNPAISEYISNSPAEIAQAIAPEIANAIREQTRLDKQAMVSAITPSVESLIEAQIADIKEAVDRSVKEVLAAAITEYINNSPEQLAQAIAPKLARAIEQQNQIDSAAMITAISPIIAGIIGQSIQSDKQSMDVALSPVLRDGIAEYIKAYPREVVQEIAPEIFKVIGENNRVDREEIVKALSPVIDRIIQTRTKEDKLSMSTAFAQVISPAISQRIEEVPEEVAMAIAPEIAAAIKEQIRLEHAAMTDALYPVIGNTIVKYIAETIREINEKIENALTPQTIGRKMRAKLKGVSEAELLLSEKMPFIIRAIFLIEKTSGLIISDIQPSGEERLEAEMVAGMLTAIRSFVSEYLPQSKQVSEIDEINYGKNKIILEMAGSCYLAVVIDGEPSGQFIDKMRQAFSQIVQNYSKPIGSYDGNPDSIPQQVHKLLEGLMSTDPGLTKRNKHPWALMAIGLILVGITTVPWGIYEYRNRVDRRLAAQVTDALAAAPELSIYRLDVEVHRGNLKLTGRVPSEYLQKKAEEIATEKAPNLELENHIIAVEVPPDPVEVEKEVRRVTTTLNQIDNIDISAEYQAGKVTVTGEVIIKSDVPKITQAFEQIPGVKSIATTIQVKPLTIATRLYFVKGSAQIKPVDISTKIIPIKELMIEYPQIHLRIVGYIDDIKDSGENQQLADQRAQAVKNILETQGIDPKRLQAVGRTHPPLDVEASGPVWLRRAVVFYPIIPDEKNQ